jgi:ribosome recycling factor
MKLKVTIKEGAPTKPFEAEVETEMKNHIHEFEKELLKIRTGRAHPSMLEDVKVPSYGTMMSLKEIASISAPEAALLVVQPWDKANIPEIEKALSTSELGLSPVNDGNVIRVQLPKMSSTRRDELVKVLGKKVEQCRLAIRNVRRDLNTSLKDLEKSKAISEDYARRLQDCLQTVTDKMIKVVDVIDDKKTNELKSL